MRAYKLFHLLTFPPRICNRWTEKIRIKCDLCA